MKKIIKLLFPKAYKEIYTEGYYEGLHSDYNDSQYEMTQDEIDYHNEMEAEHQRMLQEQAELEAEYNKDFYDSRPGDLYYDGE